jgi:hypothetical protein
MVTTSTRRGSRTFGEVAETQEEVAEAAFEIDGISVSEADYNAAMGLDTANTKRRGTNNEYIRKLETKKAGDVGAFPIDGSDDGVKKVRMALYAAADTIGHEISYTPNAGKTLMLYRVLSVGNKTRKVKNAERAEKIKAEKAAAATTTVEISENHAEPTPTE